EVGAFLGGAHEAAVLDRAIVLRAGGQPVDDRQPRGPLGQGAFDVAALLVVVEAVLGLHRLAGVEGRGGDGDVAGAFLAGDLDEGLGGGVADAARRGRRA